MKFGNQPIADLGILVFVTEINRIAGDPGAAKKGAKIRHINL
jgi:hypothetical protein